MEGAQLLGGRYALLAQLGAGGMAVVWRARDEVLGRPVAVKVLAGRHAGEPAARDRIRAEARAAAALSHPNIAQVYDYGEAREGGASIPYVVMELVRGSTLQHRMDSGPMSPRFAMRMAAEVAAALAAAHADGLVHRDIKPANVMVTESGAKVVDFGIAAAVNPAGSGDEEFEVLGTPAYLAPERLTGDGVEPASDVYALGVLLYRMLSGQSPWSVDTTTQMLSAHIYVDPEPLPPRPDVPDYVTTLCNRCLSKDTTQRPSAREAAALLAQGAGLRVVTDAPPAGPAGPSQDHEPSVVIRPRPARRLAPPSWYADPAPVAPAAAEAAAPTAIPSTGPAQVRPAAPALDPSAPAPDDHADPAATAVTPDPGPALRRPDPAATNPGPAATNPGPAATSPGPAATSPGPAATNPGTTLGRSGPADPGTAPKWPSPAAFTPGVATSAPGVAATDADPEKRSRRPLVILAALALLMIAGLLWWLIGTGDDQGDGPTTAVPPVGGGPAAVVPSASASTPAGTRSTPGQPRTPGATATAVAPAPGDPPAADGAPVTTTPAPDEEEPAPTTTAPTTDPPAQERTFTSDAGSVRATCSSPSSAELLSWSATKPYKVNDVDEDGAVVVFKHGNELVRMSVTCSGGVPSGSTDEG